MNEITKNRKLYAKLVRGIYGLPQEGILAHRKLKGYSLPHG